MQSTFNPDVIRNNIKRHTLSIKALYAQCCAHKAIATLCEASPKGEYNLLGPHYAILERAFREGAEREFWKRVTTIQEWEAMLWEVNP